MYILLTNMKGTTTIIVSLDSIKIYNLIQGMSATKKNVVTNIIFIILLNLMIIIIIFGQILMETN